MRSGNPKQANKQAPKQTVKKQETKVEVKKPETPRKHFKKNSSQLLLGNSFNDSGIKTPTGEPLVLNNLDKKEKSNENKPVEKDLNEVQQKSFVESHQDEKIEKQELEFTPGQIENQQDNTKEQQKIEEIIDSKYGDQKIDISDIKDNLQNLHTEENDPTRPQDICLDQNLNEPLPSYSNRVNLQEFSVGNYREFQLREELANLIDRYNKKFNVDSKKPHIHKDEIGGGKGHTNTKDQKYQNKMIINPIAVPDPNAAQGNFSWMYLVTPYYNQLVKDFNEKQMENHVLKQHFEYYVQMQEEKNLLNEEFDLLKISEKQMLDKINNVNTENQVLEDKMRNMERNLIQVQPERIREVNDKLENLNNILSAKDGVIDQLLAEISLIKNEKDDLQNETLFKKQRIENLNIEFNTKELEYQRLWEEQQQLKQELRGDNSDAQALKRENDMLNREIAQTRDEINENQMIFELSQQKIQDSRSKIQDYENRLRYANDLIMSLETENQQVQLDLAQARASIEGQNRAYNELRNNFYLVNQGMDPGKLSLSQSAQTITIPKVVTPSNYYRPSGVVQKQTINLMPSTTKALSQQVPLSNIKSYLSVKKATINLAPDINNFSKTPNRDQKVRFSEDQGNNRNMMAGMQNLPANNMRSSYDFGNTNRRSDSLDLRIEKRNMKKFNEEIEIDHNNYNTRNSNVPQQNQRTSSVNRNFIDTMSGLLGMSDDQQKFINQRASQNQNVFPLKRVDLDSNSPPRNTQYNKNNFDFRNIETDVSTADYRTTNDSFNNGRQYGNTSTLSAQSPLKNNKMNRGAPGNRSSQPQQINSVKQRQYPQSTKYPQQNEEEKYRQGTWGERMEKLPQNSAYKSSITFEQDGITVKPAQKTRNTQQVFYQSYQSENTQHQPFKMAKDYDIDIDTMNEDDPQAKAQITKFKQQKMFELQDQRNLLQSQLNHIPDYSKQVSQRAKKQELEDDIQKLTKRISQLKYDIRRLSSKAFDD